MIYIECKADFYLVRNLGIPEERIIQSEGLHSVINSNVTNFHVEQR